MPVAVVVGGGGRGGWGEGGEGGALEAFSNSVCFELMKDSLFQSVKKRTVY